MFNNETVSHKYENGAVYLTDLKNTLKKVPLLKNLLFNGKQENVHCEFIVF